MLTEMDCLRMFNFDCTPHDAGDELPPEMRVVEGETFYPNRGVGRKSTWLLNYTFPFAYADKQKACNKTEQQKPDYTQPALRVGKPGSAERIAAYARFYATQGEDGESPFDIPEVENDEPPLDTRPVKVFDGV